MKKLFAIIFVLFLFILPTVSFASPIEWLNETSYLNGHGVTGSLSNGLLLVAILSPALTAIVFLAIMAVRLKMKMALKRA